MNLIKPDEGRFTSHERQDDIEEIIEEIREGDDD